jgi:hypothetical protein
MVTDLGLLGAAIYSAISLDQPVLRSHPNKAVDVIVCQTFSIAFGFRVVNSCLLPGPVLLPAIAVTVLSG